MAAPKYIRNNAGTLTEQAAAETSAAEVIVATLATGLLDVSLMPTGIGAVTVAVVASEALAAGDLVNLYNNAGTLNARKADASTTGKEANGFVLGAVANAGTATVYMDDQNTAVTGLTPGTQFLSAATPGKTSAAAPTAAGQTVQRVGTGVTATSMIFKASIPYVLA